MKRMNMALAALAAAALAGCGGSSPAGSGSSSGTTGTQITSGGSIGGSSGATTGTSTSGSSGTSTSGSTGTTGGSSGSSGTTGGSTGSTGTTAGFTVAPHDPFPQVPNVSGTPTLHHVQLVTVTYNGYAHQSEVEAFGDWIVGSSWLTTVGADYDIHTGTHVAKARLTDTPPTSITDAQIQSLISAKIADGTLPAPGATLPNSTDTLTEPLYTIYFPGTTTISLQGSNSCQAFGGYHNFMTYTPSGGTATKVSYAVLPTCPAGWSGASEIDGVTVAMSHELIEAASDPFPYTGGATDTSSYVIEDYNNPWSFIPGEIGDLCVGDEYTDSASGYRVQRVWSNTAAAATPGQSPCIPAGTDPYFNVSTDLVTSQVAAAGATVTYHVRAWSSGPVNGGKWGVAVYPYQASFNPHYTLTTADGQSVTDANPQGYVTMGNGDTATFTVTIPAGTTNQSCGGYCYSSMMLASSMTGASFNMWPTAVFVQ